MAADRRRAGRVEIAGPARQGRVKSIRTGAGGRCSDRMNDSSRYLWLAGGVAAPLLLGAALRPFEEAVGVPTVTLVLVLPVVVVAATGRWLPAVAAALSG